MEGSGRLIGALIELAAALEACRGPSALVELAARIASGPAETPVPICGRCIDRREAAEIATRRGELSLRDWARTGPLDARRRIVWEAEEGHPLECSMCGALTEYRAVLP